MEKAEAERGCFQRLLRRIAPLLRREPALLPFDWVKGKVRIKGWRHLGLRTVEIQRIVGSVNRYRDFDRAFLPRHADRARLGHIQRAMARGEPLPPVQLYKMGDIYFMVDGHHRVAVARRQGARFIDAEVTEFVPDVPLEPGVTEKDVLRKAEYSEFLRRTRLDELRPDQQIEFSALGRYMVLLDHIDVHRYFRGREEGGEIPYQEAVGSWYDRVYKPLVEEIRRAGILKYFRRRTEADLYVWISEHLYYLRERHGPGVRVEEAARDFVHHYGRGSRGLG